MMSPRPEDTVFEAYRRAIGPALRDVVRLSRRALRRVADSLGGDAGLDEETPSAMRGARRSLQNALDRFALAHARAIKSVHEATTAKPGRPPLAVHEDGATDSPELR